MKHRGRTIRALLSRVRGRGRTRSNRLQSCKKSVSSEIKKTIIVENFMEMLNTIKLYHWNTHSFAQHKATDELHEKMSGHVDKFVEILLGKKGDRILHIKSTIPIMNNKTVMSFRDQVYKYRQYLIDMDGCFNSTNDTDLLNVRDEILGDINQFLYLLTLEK
jgi:DNA-binding ferritin-like protein